MQTVSLNSQGVYVQYLTLALIRAGYAETISDTFNQSTETAVISFQNDNNLSADGIAGANTWQALMPYLLGYQTAVAQNGETLSQIANRFNTSEQAVKIANPDISEALTEGQNVTVPYRFDVVATNVDYTYEITEIFARGITARYPDTQKGYAGKSIMGSDLITLELGSGETEVFFNASHHANEWITTPVVLKYVEDLSKAIAFGGEIYGIDAKTLMGNKKLYVMPLVNPDGVDLVNGAIGDEYFLNLTKEISQRYPDITYPSGWKANILGTDLNLNYPANWLRAREIKFAMGYTSPAPRDYVGETPLSAQEARIVYDYTLNHDFALTISYHTQGNVIYWKYLDYLPERSLEIANALADVSGYTLSLTPESSSYAGYKDWFISYYNRPGYTVEVGQGVNPLSISQFDSIYERNLPLMTTALDMA